MSDDTAKRRKAERITNTADDLRRKEEFDEAIVRYREAIEIDPTYSWPYVGLSLSYRFTDNDAKALELLTESVKVCADLNVIRQLGITYIALDRWNEGVQTFLKALESHPNDAYTLHELGDAYQKMGDLIQAISCFKKAVECDPSYSYAFGELGRIALRQGNVDEAIRYFESAIREAEKSGGSNFWAAELSEAQRRLRQRDQWETLPTVEEMLSYLNRFVCGQESAKEALATAIYNHFISVSYQEADILNTDLGRYNILLFGPSGCGKTYMIELLTKKLGVPLVIESATSLVQTGYVGKKIDSIVEDLLTAADYRVARAERGIVFIDEIDKVRAQGGSGPDVSGEGVQNALLTMLEGKEFRIQNSKGTFTINTSKVLFICAGAFDGIIDGVRRRLDKKHGRIGFSSTSTLAKQSDDSTLLDSVTVDDLQEYGIIPQLTGRFATIANLRLLTREDLRNILTKMEGSIIEKQRKLFALHGIALSYRPDALEAILDLTSSAKTGARGLRASINQSMRQVSSKVASLAAEGITAVTITRESILKGEPPLFQSGREGKSGDSAAAKLRQDAFARKDLPSPFSKVS